MCEPNIKFEAVSWLIICDPIKIDPGGVVVVLVMTGEEIEMAVELPATGEAVVEP